MLTTIAHYSFPLEAQIAKARLASEGIPGFIADEHTIGMDWLYSNALGGVRLQVPEQFAAEAVALLAQDFSDCLEDDCQEAEPKTDNPQQCAACLQGRLEPCQIGRRMAYLSWLLFGVPITPVAQGFKCDTCGKVFKAN